MKGQSDAAGIAPQEAIGIASREAIGIALVGCGTVGSAVAELLSRDQPVLRTRSDIAVLIVQCNQRPVHLPIVPDRPPQLIGSIGQHFRIVRIIGRIQPRYPCP